MNCKDCQHWESGVALMGFRSCGKLSADYGNPYTYKNPPSDDVKALVIKGRGMNWEHEGDFMTAPDFGCNQFERAKTMELKIRPPVEVEAIHKHQVEYALLVALAYCQIENLPEFKEELKKSIDALFAQFNESAIMERGKNDNAVQR